MGDGLNKSEIRRLEKIEEKLDIHGIDIASIKEQNKTIFSKLDDINDTLNKKLYGNGKKGLCDVVTEHSTYFKIFGVAIAFVPPLAALIVKFIFG